MNAWIIDTKKDKHIGETLSHRKFFFYLEFLYLRVSSTICDEIVFLQMCIMRVIEHGLRYKIVLDMMLNLMFNIFVDLSVFKSLFCWKNNILSFLSYHFSFKCTHDATPSYI